MRYENILQIYWSKGFFFGGNLFYFENKTLTDLLDYMPGFGTFFKKKYSERFELTFFLKDKKRTLVNYQNETIRSITKPTNIIFSQINSVNNQRPELYYLNIIRLYLIKTYRGRCHALGKPVRGQRTWSNSWNSYNTNKTLRTYISETTNQLRAKEKVEKINYKIIKKKYTSKKKKKSTRVKKKILWF